MKTINLIEKKNYRIDYLTITYIVDKAKIAEILLTLDFILKSNKKYQTPKDNLLASYDNYVINNSAAILKLTSDGQTYVTFSTDYLSKKYSPTLTGLTKSALKLLRTQIYSGINESEEYLTQFKTALIKKINDSNKKASTIVTKKLKENFYPDLFTIDDECNVDFIENLTMNDIKKTYKNINSSNRYAFGASANIKISNKYLKKYFKPNAKLEPISFYKEFDLINGADVFDESNKYINSTLGITYVSKSSNSIIDQFIKQLSLFILSNSSSSILFTEVREKRGLCYSIYSTALSNTNIVNIFVDINKKDYQETLKLVDNLVNSSSTIVSDSLFSAAISDMVSNLIDIQSSPIDLVSFTKKLRLYDYQKSIDELIEEIKNIKKEEIINFLKTLKKNGSYALLGTKEVQESWEEYNLKKQRLHYMKK